MNPSRTNSGGPATGLPKHTTQSALLASALALGAAGAPATSPGQLAGTGNFIATEVFATGQDSMNAFDRGADGNYYYTTSNASDGSLTNSSFWRYDGGGHTRLYNAPDRFGGAGVAAVNDRVFFNDSNADNDQFIHNHAVGSGTTSEVSSQFNSGLAGNQPTQPDRLWVTGADPATISTEILFADTDADGDLAGGFTSIGEPGGASGPMRFDASGNLFYAEGFATRFFAWSATRVEDAIDDPANNVLLPGNADLVYDYGNDFSGPSGASGMTFDEKGFLNLTLTDFDGPSMVVRFILDALEVSDAEQLASASGRIGNMRFIDGELQVATGDGVFSVVPEPSHAALAAGVLTLAAAVYRRRNSAAR